LVRSCVAIEEFFLVDVAFDGDVEKADHHFVVGLIAPADGAVGIGVVRIVFGVVIPGDGLEFGACFQRERVGEFVAHLPVEMVVHAKQSLDRIGIRRDAVRMRAGRMRIVWMDDVVFEAFAAEMHMGEEAEEEGVVGERAAGFVRTRLGGAVFAKRRPTRVVSVPAWPLVV
jgi:hypothetical protein